MAEYRFFVSPKIKEGMFKPNTMTFQTLFITERVHCEAREHRQDFSYSCVIE
jgi:hypothetical protein